MQGSKGDIDIKTDFWTQWEKERVGYFAKTALKHTYCVHAKLCLTLCNTIDCSPPGSSLHGHSPGENTGVNCHALLQGIFLTQGLNPCLLCLLHWQADFLYHQLHLAGETYTLRACKHELREAGFRNGDISPSSCL